jgi:small-conductance mechanosensitive channel
LIDATLYVLGSLFYRRQQKGTRRSHIAGASFLVLSSARHDGPDLDGRVQMMDLIVEIETVAQDPLVIALGLLLVGVVTARLLFRAHPVRRALTRFVFFILLTIALLSGQIIPYQPIGSSGPVLHRAVGVVLQIAWWVWAAWLLVGILRIVLVFELRPREGKLLQDILAGLVYLAAFFAIVAYVFNLPVQGLIATSGAIAIIIGLALQSSMSDVFSGLVLSFSRPYRLDDWIKLEGGTEGKVIELNWRATHILTAQHDLAIVPNSTIAKSKIVNMSSPSRIHGMRLVVQLDARTPPSTGISILRHALMNSRRVLAFPEPSIAVKSMNAASVEYELSFFVESLNLATDAQNEVFDLICRHVTAADIHLASPLGQPTLDLSNEAPRTPRSDTERVLEQVTIFHTLTPDERSKISAKLTQQRYDSGEVLVQPGVVLQSLFFIGSGVVSVTREENNKEVELLRLGPGDHFGEMGLLTGMASVPRITALTPAVIYALSKADLAPVLEARPQVAQELCHALAQRQAAGRIIGAAELGKATSTRNLSSWFSERVRKIFDLERA